MAENPYLVALALIEQDGRRSMPLGGRSLKESIDLNSFPNEIGESIALELLLRLMKRSDSSPLNRVGGEKGLLLLAIDFEKMNNMLPVLKAKWIDSGDAFEFVNQLKQLCIGVWTLSFVRYKGIEINKI